MNQVALISGGIGSDHYGVESCQRGQFVKAGDHMSNSVQSLDANGGRIAMVFGARNEQLTVQNQIGSLMTFGYDACNRLTQEETSVTNANKYNCTYDSGGNRLTSNETDNIATRAYNLCYRNSTGMELNAVSSYSYNTSGSLFSVCLWTGDCTTMGYDMENRVKSLQYGAVLTTFGYVGDRARVKETSILVWDGSIFLGMVN